MQHNSLRTSSKIYLKPLFFLSILALLSGCSSYGVITNEPQNLGPTNDAKDYSIKSIIANKPQGKVTLVLAFSGGGTRASALAYGVLQELNDTQLLINQQHINLLDEVDVISAVSGGSFTAAYYGLKGKKTFKEFENIMLKRDLEDELISGVLKPMNWFADTGRTEMAIQLYNQSIFKDANFKDLRNSGGPLILINASDLSNGVRFSFTQEYFDLLCSDISEFSVAKAVTASSAVPLVFNPVVLQNHQPCNNNAKQQLNLNHKFAQNNYELLQTIKGLSDYTDNKYPFLQLVDGGITDNLGLRAIYEIIELSNGPKTFLQQVGKTTTQQIAVISVDASTKSAKTMRLSNKIPSLRQSVEALSDIQIHRYNASTLELFEQSLQRWSKQVSNNEQQVLPHFIQLNFNQLETAELRDEFNLIPTSLSLTAEQVNKLIHAGRHLLRNNLDFQVLLQSLDNNSLTSKAH